VVQFDNQWYWDQGKVIGFAEGPKLCIPEYIYLPLRHYMSNWEGFESGVNVYWAGVYSHSADGCPELLIGMLNPVNKSNGIFYHSIEYRDGAFDSHGNANISILPSSIIAWREMQTVSYDMHPTRPDATYVETVGEPNVSYNIGISSGGIYIQKDLRMEPVSLNLPSARYPAFASTAPPCEGYNYYEYLVGGYTPGHDLVGEADVNEYLINSTEQVEIDRWAYSNFDIPPQVEYVIEGNTIYYENPQIWMDSSLSIRMLIRYRAVK